MLILGIMDINEMPDDNWILSLSLMVEQIGANEKSEIEKNF